MEDLEIDPSWMHFQADYSGLRRTCQYCPERPVVSLQLLPGREDTITSKLTVRRVLFTVVAHDQGWSDSSESDGTFKGSHTWFEARILTRSGQEQPLRQHFQSNIRGSAQPRKHMRCWDYRDAGICGTEAVNAWTGRTSKMSIVEWLSRIGNGDSIQILPKALFVMWTNCVLEARIEIWTEWITMAPVNARKNILYRRLDSSMSEIRLVQIEPCHDSDSEPIKLSLKYTCLNDANHVKFEALSYCWGEENELETVIISDGTHDLQEVTVRKNLYQALRHLRHNHMPRRYWIDLFSINQQDYGERAQQVAMMSHIYRSAEGVTVWLGEADQATEEDMTASMAIANAIKMNSIADLPVADFIDNDRLLSRPWLSRVWVLQEVWSVAASTADKDQAITVLCGKYTIPWSHILHVNRFYESNYGHRHNHTIPEVWSTLFELTEHPTSSSVARKELKCVPKPQIDILSVFIGALEMRASDPRDKLFALLGFGEETHDVARLPQLIRPDYLKTAAQVFADFSRWWIEENLSLRILSAVQMLHGHAWIDTVGSNPPFKDPWDGSERPSWALWSAGNGHWRRATLGFEIDCPYNACGNEILDVELLRESHSARTNTIRLRGVLLGKITQFAPYPGSKQLPGLHRAYGQIFDARVWESSKVQDRTAVKQTLQGAHWQCHWNPHGEQHVSNVGMYFPCHGTPVFVTDDQRIGLAPAPARPGDHIVVLHGGRVPYILRPANDDEWDLVGECYVEGIMQGETFAADPSTLSAGTFTLR